MSDHINPEELSAFIDGEARNASKIRLHTEHCEECTGKIVALRDLSQSFKTLEEPDVHPAFATRVRATIEDGAFEGEPVSLYRWAFSLSSIVALTLLSVSLFADRDTAIQPAGTDTLSIAEAEWKSILQQDETELAQQLEISLAREWVDSALPLAPYEVAAADSADTETAVLSIVLSNAEPEALRSDLLVKESDAMTEISRMSPTQSDLFKQMLVMHGREEILGDNAFEG